MTKQTRLGFILAAILLIPVYFTPIWSITMKAPQYPDGLGMHIWVNDITGHQRHDLQNINILNHYIGMKEIHPEEVPELRIIPWVFAGLIAMAVIVAVTGKLWLAWTWVILFIIAGIGGMIDFYLWGYDYGHNLNPRAAIKVPGMTYQPPLLGSKTLLNITASSWPYWGSLWVGLSLLTGAGSAWREKKFRKKHHKEYRMTAGMTAAAVCIMLLSATGCGDNNDRYSNNDLKLQGSSDRTQTFPIDLSIEASSDPTHNWNGKGINLFMEWCDFTGKQIRSKRYGAVLVDHSGNMQRFRSVESMIRKLAAENKTLDDFALAGIVEFISAEKLYAPDELIYHISRNLPSPDGGNISALNPDANQGLLFNIGEAYPGKRISWEEVWDMVVNENS